MDSLQETNANRYHIRLHHCIYTGDMWHVIWDEFTGKDLFADEGAVNIEELKKIRNSMNVEFSLYNKAVLEYINGQIPETIYQECRHL